MQGPWDDHSVYVRDGHTSVHGTYTQKEEEENV